MIKSDYQVGTYKIRFDQNLRNNRIWLDQIWMKSEIHEIIERWLDLFRRYWETEITGPMYNCTYKYICT